MWSTTHDDHHSSQISTGKRILVTGVTGMVAGPMAAQLVAAGNTVYGAARFADPAQREAHEANGITTIRVDLEHGELDEVPDGLDYVLHFAVAKTNDFGRDLAANADGAATSWRRCRASTRSSTAAPAACTRSTSTTT